MYEVIGHTKSRTFRILWMLEELELPYRHIDTPMRSELVKQFNPSGKVPILRDGGAILTDSCAIMTYLGDKHGRLTYPAGTIPRARQDALSHMLLDEIDTLLWTAARHSFILPEERRVPAIEDTLRWEFERNAERLVDILEGPFLMGDVMTVPDILATHCLNWAITANFPVEHPSLRDYVAAMHRRPAYQRAAASGSVMA